MSDHPCMRLAGKEFHRLVLSNAEGMTSAAISYLRNPLMYNSSRLLILAAKLTSESKMFELPEYVVLARQMNDTLQGKIIQRGQLGNSPHKFVWYNRTPEQFEKLTKGKRIGAAWTKGRWLFVPLEPGYILLFGENGGKMLYHLPGAKLPKKYHLYLQFEDDSFFTATTQMWGAYELYEKGEEQKREYVKDMRTTPAEDGFTYAYFSDLIDTLVKGKKRSAKSLLTQDQVIPGLGNAIAQDILFKARLNPRHAIADLDSDQRRALYDAIQDTVAAVIAQGGRYDETDPEILLPVNGKSK